MRSHMDHSFCIIFGIIWHRSLAAENLTSLRPVSTSAGPTKVHNRITVIDEKRTTVDFFASSKYRRDEDEETGAADIWKWDFWCHQQPKSGVPCLRQSNVTMYYYQPRLDRCETFSFSGCEGNKNQFNTKKECERHCLGAGLMYQEKIDPFMACEMQPSGGVCLGYMTRMYFDINDSKCKSFLYSGCGGNPNNFETTAECLNICFENTMRKNKAEAEARKGSGSDDDNW